MIIKGANSRRSGDNTSQKKHALPPTGMSTKYMSLSA
jgi:hypothetical protein